MGTSTLEKHQVYTRNEFKDNEYYSKVLDVLKSNDIKSMIDAGACTGEVTKVMFEFIPTLKISYLIEPMKENIEFIKENLKEYQTEVINKALLYGEKTVSFGKIPHNVGGGSVFLQGDRVVDTITLEELPLVDFLKMDIEGLEANVIKNSTNLQKTKFIEVEFHHYDELLEKEENRIPFVNEWLPNHKVLFGGKGTDKESSLFLQLKW